MLVLFKATVTIVCPFTNVTITLAELLSEPANSLALAANISFHHPTSKAGRSCQATGQRKLRLNENLPKLITNVNTSLPCVV